MKFPIITVFFIVIINLQNAVSQQSGINFEKATSWTKIKEKSKKENKIIFLDAYTTWCIPCKEMAVNVFTKKDVGDFFNENFINIAVQFDKTKKDNNNTKSWYNDIEYLKKTYKINSYPSYLFFNTKGELVHSISANFNPKQFISDAEKALKPATQYATLKRLFENGRRDTSFLSSLATSAQANKDYANVAIYSNLYLARQENLLTPKNIKLITRSTSKTTDIGYPVLVKNADLVDTLMGRGTAGELVKTIVFEEEVFPLLKKNGIKKIFGIGFYEYQGENNKNFDWNAIDINLKTKYPQYASEVLNESKIMYYQWERDWKGYTEAVNDYIKMSGKGFELGRLDTYARTVLLFCDDPSYFPVALDWSKKVLEAQDSEKPWFINTYSNLLFKVGKKQEAIQSMEKAIRLSGSSNPQYEKELKQMKSPN
ncbi:thioredoxin family protein [Pedobacter agri]|uniref:Thioredoxin fold domain-containing protein n=1 Tax=Pedobacter agri TaxID=454586 RepID=A0A9X3DI12_9SPHI|nr:thioredoxin fold domain-containing protein [Pedobacter agri]MCX3267481.1 thioredoxin fold domain-containing protein [Pedobacter agri]